MSIKKLNFIDAVFKIFFVICVFVSPLVFAMDLTRNPFSIQTTVLAAAAALMLAAWGARVMLRREIIFKYTRADFWFFAFIAFALFSTILNSTPALWGEFLRRGHVLFTNALAAWFIAKAFAPYEGGEKKEVFSAANYLAIWAAVWFIYPAFKTRGFFDIYAALAWGLGIWLCFKHLRKNSVKEVCDIFIAVAAIACAYGVLQNLGLEFLWRLDISYQFGSRAVSTFGNPNFLSSYVTLVLPLTVIYFLKAKNKTALFYYFALVILFAVYLAVSATRSSWLGAGAGIAVLFLFKDLRALSAAAKKRAALLFICAVLAFALWPASALSRARESLPANLSLSAPQGQINQAWHQRLIMWACAADAAKAAPLTGGGWGGFQLNYAPCQGQILTKYPHLKTLRTQANAAHNELAEVLAQTGLPGTALYIIFYAALLLAFAKKYKNLQPNAKLFYAALLAGAAGMFADNMLNITLQTSVLAFAFWFILSSINTAAASERKQKINTAGGIIIFALCLLCAAILCAWQFGRIKAEAADFEGYKFMAQNNFKAAAHAAQEALKTPAPLAESYYLLINSLMKAGDNNAAHAVAQKAAKYHPHYHEFHFRAAALQAPPGADNLAQVLRLYPGYYPAAASLALLLEAEPSDANISLLESVLPSMPYATDIKLKLAQIYLNAGRRADALNTATAVLAQDNLDPQALAFLTTQAAQSGLIKKAQTAQDLKKLLAQSPLPKNAEAKINAFHKANPGSLAAAMLLGEFYFKNNNPQKAAQILLEVYPQNQTDAALNFALASAHGAMGKPTAAAEYLRAVLAQNPFNETAARRIAVINK